MEQTFSGISIRNFGCTRFYSTIPARALFLRARKWNSTWRELLIAATARAGSWLAILQRNAKTCFKGRMAARPHPFPSGILLRGVAQDFEGVRTARKL